MTESEKLTMLKAMVGDSDTDEVLSAYLNIAGSKILAKAYPYNDEIEEIPKKYHTLQCEVAAYLLKGRRHILRTEYHVLMKTRIFQNQC